MKTCPRCKDPQDDGQFSPKNTYCKNCSAEIRRGKRAEHTAKGKCSICGVNEPAESKRLCTPCADTANTRFNDTRRSKKARAVAFFGGRCADCGFETLELCVYDFHHLNSTTKDINFRGMRSWGWERILSELMKCIMLCANCHRIRHAKEGNES